jgi:REase_MTES_1575
VSRPDWSRIARYYAKHNAVILAAGPNAWGLDPYQWEFEGEIKLSPIERMFWFDVRACGVVLYPQYPVGRFFVDFANPAARVAVECDGAAYHQDPERDGERQAEIEAMGWLVLRIVGSDCYRDDSLRVDESGRSTYSGSPGRDLLKAVCERRDIRISRFYRSPAGALGDLVASLTTAS